MKLVSSLIAGASLAAFASTLLLGACGGDKSVVGGTGGAASTAGGSGAGGDTSASAGGGSANTGGSPAGGCTGPTTVPTNALMTDFTEFVVGTSSASGDMKWGNSSKTLTGGTFLYQQSTADAPTGVVTSSGLEITATIAATEYDGFGFYFGPNCGSDACAYSGFSFTIAGSLGGTDIDIQMQQTADYPLASSNKGSCDYAAAGYDSGTMWSYCANPHVKLSTLLPNGVTTAAQTVQVPWSALVGGNPVDAIDCTQLLGIQFQFNCGTTACPVDVTLGTLTFYKSP